MGKESDLLEDGTSGLQRNRPNLSGLQYERLTGWLILLLMGVIYCSTLQTVVNGSPHPYTTDVGEIQNALPRWGTLHFSGYPQYSLLGSIWTSILMFCQLSPAAATALFSVLWSLITLFVLIQTLNLLGVQTHWGGLAALLFGLSTSMWVDSSIAELHTMTMALTILSVYFALRFGRTGDRGDFLWLAAICANGIVHTRAFLFVGIGILWIALPRWRVMLRSWLPASGLVLIAMLTYLYLPIRDWMGADWIFSNPGTLDGFTALILDTKADRIVSTPGTAAEWIERLSGLATLLRDDWPLWLLASGLIGLLWPGSFLRYWERIGLTLVWVPVFILSLIIWEGRVSDALLAVKMPVVLLAALGLGILVQTIHGYLLKLPFSNAERLTNLGLGSLLGLLGLFLYVDQVDFVRSITQNRDGLTLAVQMDEIEPDGRPMTLMGMQGNDFWQMAYADYTEEYENLQVVDHNANFEEIMNRGDRLITPENSFYSWSVAEWEDRTDGTIVISSAAPGMISLERERSKLGLSDQNREDVVFDLRNGVGITAATLRSTLDGKLILSLQWVALEDDLPNFSVAVHALSNAPPTSPEDILIQADRNHPVYGWYPTSQWVAGELIDDHYEIQLEDETLPTVVRVGMYRQVDGTFENSEWLDIPTRAYRNQSESTLGR
ncbi:MAG: DUF2723 domain-containing protein [Chloroflexota bacterium]